MFFVRKNTIDKWFRSLSRDERKLLLSDLHYMRQLVSMTHPNYDTSGVKRLISRLEYLHEKSKLFRGYL